MYSNTSTVYIVYIIEWMIAKLKGILLLYNFQSTAHNSSWALLPCFYFYLTFNIMYFTAISHRKTSKEFIFSLILYLLILISFSLQDSFFLVERKCTLIYLWKEINGCCCKWLFAVIIYKSRQKIIYICKSS